MSEINANTLLCIHFDGEDASTTFVDSSPYAHSLSAQGTAQLDTDWKKFGTASLLSTGTANYVTSPNHAHWNLGSTFTIDLWVKYGAVPSSWPTFLAHAGAAGNRGWAVQWDGTNIAFYWTTDGTTWKDQRVAWTPVNGNTYHVAIVRNGSSLYFFVGGSQVGTTKTIGSDVIFSSTDVLQIGRASSSWWIDEVRIQNEAIWTSNFTPPTEAYSSDIPIVTAFVVPSTSNSLTIPITTFTASGGVGGVAGYKITESASAPGAGDAGWIVSAPTTYTTGSEGSKTLYAWVKDTADNVSVSLNDGVVVDATKPIITGFVIKYSKSSPRISIVQLTAEDNIGVTGYMVNESAVAPSSSDSGWQASAPTLYLCGTMGAKTLYAWAKDAVGNVSLSSSQSFTLQTRPGATLYIGNRYWADLSGFKRTVSNINGVTVDPDYKGLVFTRAAGSFLECDLETVNSRSYFGYPQNLFRIDFAIIPASTLPNISASGWTIICGGNDETFANGVPMQVMLYKWPGDGIDRLWIANMGSPITNSYTWSLPANIVPDLTYRFIIDKYTTVFPDGVYTAFGSPGIVRAKMYVEGELINLGIARLEDTAYYYGLSYSDFVDEASPSSNRKLTIGCSGDGSAAYRGSPYLTFDGILKYLIIYPYIPDDVPEIMEDVDCTMYRIVHGIYGKQVIPFE